MFINRDFSMVNYKECTCHFQRIVASWWVRIYFVEILNYPLYERQLNTSSNQQYITILHVTNNDLHATLASQLACTQKLNK